MSELDALEGRVTRLEDQIAAGFLRIEGLLRTEITDLKNEQIQELRKANERVTEEQRRMWEHVGALELRETRRSGGERKLASIGHLVSGGIGALLSAIITWLSTGHR